MIRHSFAFLAVLMFTGCAARLRDTRFAVTGVTLAGPASIGADNSAYTVTFTINRDNAAAGDTLDAFVVLKDRDGFLDPDDVLVRRQVTIPAQANQMTTTLNLRCAGSGVRGAAGSSGEGRKFLWFFDDPAEVFATVKERDSAVRNVRCSN